MKNFYTTILSIIALSTPSCETQVDLNLKSVEPKLVIDASIGVRNPCRVILSKTRDYDDQTPPEYVKGAKVTLTDSNGHSEVLVDVGDIHLSRAMGHIGETYTLTVELDGETYTATDMIPTFVPIDELLLYRIKVGNEAHYYPQIAYQDPKGEDNYYYHLLTINDKTMLQANWEDDKNRDGLIIKSTLYFDKDENQDNDLKVGDHIRVEMQTLGKGAYTFYKTISSPGGAANSNPKSNFSGNVLGMFKTYNTTYIEATLTEEDFDF